MNCHNVGETRLDNLKEINVAYCRECASAPVIQFYICEDCGEPIETDNYSIETAVGPYCLHCTRVRTARQMAENINKSKKEECVQKMKITCEYNAIGRNSLLYGLYELGYSDKELGKIVGLGSSGVANWRWKRNIPPNFEETDKVDTKGRFKPKNIKGSRDIYTHTRDLLIKWKYNIMKNDGFVCQLCGSKKDKEVHHNQETFMDIMKKFLPNRELEKELTWDEKKVIAKKIADYHYSNNVSAITLCHSCHQWIHHLNPISFQ